MRDLVVGVDVGTTVVKSAAFTLADPATPCCVHRRPAATRTPRPGWSEADPYAVEAAAWETLRAVAAEVGAERIVAVGISGTACGAWLVDDSNEPVRPAILWNDGRAAPIAARWQEEGKYERIFAISGNAPFPGYTLPVLAWLAEQEPASLERATAVLCCKDWLRGRLTGEIASDESDASYVPFDIRLRTWSDELLELTGLSAFRRLFPPLLDPAAVAPLQSEAARATGLLAGTPVAVGATDIVAGVVGAGGLATGDGVTLFGTSANSTIVTAEPIFAPAGIGLMAAAPLGRFARSFVNTSGSATLDWAAALLTGGDVSRLVALAAEAPVGSDGILCVPYLSPAGTVSPRVDPHATGTIAGLRQQHGPAHLARAAIEGLALAVADCYASLTVPVARIVAVGGAARSDLLLQALADAAGVPVVRLCGEEFGARGVALLAAWAIGAVADLENTARTVEIGRTFQPDPGSALTGALDRYRQVAATGLREGSAA